MVWAFDPRKLIEEEKENEKKKVKEVLSEQEEYDKIVEEQQAKAEKIKDQGEKKGKVAEAFEDVKDILNEVNYLKKYGGKKFLEENKRFHRVLRPQIDLLFHGFWTTFIS